MQNLEVLEGERLDVSGHPDWRELRDFQNLCDRAGVTGTPMLPNSNGLAARRQLRRRLRAEFYRMEEASNRPYQPELPLGWPRHLRRRSKVLPRQRTGRIWVGADVVLGCLEKRRMLLLRIARAFEPD